MITDNPADWKTVAQRINRLHCSGFHTLLKSPFAPGQQWYAGITPHHCSGFNGGPDYEGMGATALAAIDAAIAAMDAAMGCSGLIADLQKLGFNQFGSVGGNCPLQVEAHHDSGVSIYFRARGDRASLEVYDFLYDMEGDLPDEDCIADRKEVVGYAEYEAGWITCAEAAQLIRTMWQSCQEQR